MAILGLGLSIFAIFVAGIMQLLSMEALVNQSRRGTTTCELPAGPDYNHFLITRLGAGCYNVIWSDKLLNMMSKKWGKFDYNHFLRTRLGAGS